MREKARNRQMKSHSEIKRLRPRAETFIAKGWLKHSVVCLAQGQFLKAFLALETAMALDRTALSRQHRQAWTLMRQGRLDEARALVVRLQPRTQRSVPRVWALA